MLVIHLINLCKFISITNKETIFHVNVFYLNPYTSIFDIYMNTRMEHVMPVPGCSLCWYKGCTELLICVKIHTSHIYMSIYDVFFTISNTFLICFFFYICTSFYEHSTEPHIHSTLHLCMGKRCHLIWNENTWILDQK